MNEDIIKHYNEYAAKEAITTCVTNLFIATDERDWPKAQACMTKQVRLDMTSLAGGRPTDTLATEITGGWEEFLRPLTAVHHQIGNLLVSLKGDEAEVTCYGIAYHYLANVTGNNTRVFVGDYKLHIILLTDTWKIDAFTFNLKFIDGNKDLEADAKSSQPVAPHAA